MEERGIDRRVRKTKRQLRQALMDLMSEKPNPSPSASWLSVPTSTAVPSISTIRTSAIFCSGWRTRWPSV